jgi:hypothetical protein
VDQVVRRRTALQRSRQCLRIESVTENRLSPKKVGLPAILVGMPGHCAYGVAILLQGLGEPTPDEP